MLVTNASADPRFANHPGLALYGINSYIAVPLMRRNGSWFGTLCALDPAPSAITEDSFQIFKLLATLIAFELEADERQRCAEAELAEAQALAAAREHFIAAVTHDLRTPLSAIKTTAQTLLRYPWLPADAKPDVAGIVDSSNRIARLVADLLDFTRGRLGGEMPISPQPLDIAALCRDLVQEARSAWPGRLIEVDQQACPTAAVDPVRFGQAISNLIANAVQHSPAGTPVRVRLSGRIIEISNEGLIEPDRLEHIFDPIRRGRGLGLYIAREIVAAHGGCLTVASADGCTTATVELAS